MGESEIAYLDFVADRFLLLGHCKLKDRKTKGLINNRIRVKELNPSKNHANQSLSPSGINPKRALGYRPELLLANLFTTKL